MRWLRIPCFDFLFHLLFIVITILMPINTLYVPFVFDLENTINFGVLFIVFTFYGPILLQV